MSIQVYNTLTRKKEPFNTIEPGKVKLYVCGVTVYDYCHLGHARAYVSFDVVKRYLKHRGYDVHHVQNFTDIDDKIIKRSNEQNIPYHELTEKFIGHYFEDMKSLNIQDADIYPKATDYIPQMISFIEGLIEKGHAYAVGGSVFFSVKSSKDYGKLSNKILDDLENVHRVDPDRNKKYELDFVLWKPAKAGEPSWESPWGNGRPGWHIECSAMANAIHGDTLDIHAGGQDLIFPHHENEICQSECHNNAKFANYWMHNGFVNIKDEKMSKSLGNFLTIRDILNQYSGEVARFFLMRIHYRNPINFSQEELQECQVALGKLHGTLINHKEHQDINPELKSEFDEIESRFYAAMDNDFNSAEAIGVLFDLSRLVNSSNSGAALLEKLGKLLGLFYEVEEPETALDADIEALIAARTEARQNKDFAKSDAIRDQLLNEFNIVIEDTAEGIRWKKA